MLNENRTIRLEPRTDEPSWRGHEDKPKAAIKVTIRKKTFVDMKDGEPHPHPHWRIDCDGLPTSGQGTMIPNFNLFKDARVSPDALEVGKTYEITGELVRNDRFYNIDSVLREVVNAAPGVAGVPKDWTREYMLNACMAAAATITASLHATEEGIAEDLVEYNMECSAKTFDYIYRQVLATRTWQEDHPTDV